MRDPLAKASVGSNPTPRTTTSPGTCSCRCSHRNLLDNNNERELRTALVCAEQLGISWHSLGTGDDNEDASLL